ncbi:MAG: hypothetical protein KKF88_03110 [Alphaproteobacteria bacterium]|nr:hypothetical protein [Alphaproteobacteria bacterium]
MIRTTLLACALVAIPSAALAQSRIATPPEVRVLRAPAAALVDGPPADGNRGLAPSSEGWIYQEIPASVTGGGSVRPQTTLYRGVGYPATIMVCPRVRPILLPVEPRDVSVAPDSCATITADHVYVSPLGMQQDQPPIPIRYRILAVHRAAE